MQLSEIAKYIRSKNAGPFWVTIDIFCDSDEAFNIVTGSSALTADSISHLYGVDQSSVKIFHQKNIRVVKISIPRTTISGSFEDRDMHAGQYFVPMLKLQIDAHNFAPPQK